MNGAEIVSVIVALIALCGTVYQSRSNRRTAEHAAEMAANKVADLTIYRVDQLEEHVDKHNCLIERMYDVEKVQSVQGEQIKVVNHRLDDIERKEDKA